MKADRKRPFFISLISLAEDKDVIDSEFYNIKESLYLTTVQSTKRIVFQEGDPVRLKNGQLFYSMLEYSQSAITVGLIELHAHD